MRTIGTIVLLFAVGLFISDRLIDAFGRHWWIAPFRYGPLTIAFYFRCLRTTRPQAQS